VRLALTLEKSAGSSIKILNGGSVVAIFKTAAAAKAALGRVKSPHFELRQWAPVVLTSQSPPPLPGDALEAERAKSPTLP